MPDKTGTPRWVWITITVAVIGFAGMAGAFLTLLLTRNDGEVTQVETADQVEIPTTASTMPTISTTSTTTAPPPTTATTVPPPRGFVTYKQGGAYGQSFPSGNCGNWFVAWINNSNTEVVKIIFDPPGASYSNGKYTPEERIEHPAADPPPTVLNVSILPNATQEIRFQTCTPTPPPPDAPELGVLAPLEFRWEWLTGHRGRGCYGLGCQ